MAVPFASPADALWADRFFANRPTSRKVWDALVASIDHLDGVEQTSTQSRVSLKARAIFAWCPTAHTAGTIFVRIWLPRPVESDKELRIDMADDGRAGVRVRLALDDVDDEVVGWLERAYAMDVG